MVGIYLSPDFLYILHYKLNLIYSLIFYRPDKTIIKECFQALLDKLYWSHMPIVSAAADCLITFAQNSLMWSNNKEVSVLINL